MVPLVPGDAPLRISQGHLDAIETCPRRFQYQYLERWGTLLDQRQSDRVDWGARFHRLAQQHLLGVDVGPVLAQDADLDRCWRGLVAAVPEWLGPAATADRTSEYRLTWPLPCDRDPGAVTYLLTVVYDLLVVAGDRVTIADWKTYPKPTDRQRLLRAWQTRLYRFLLVAAGGWSPAAVSMTYWFVRSDRGGPESLTFAYDDAQYEGDGAELRRLVEAIEAGRQAVAAGQSLPQIDRGQPNAPCDRCPFVQPCWGDPGGAAPPLLAIDEIPEFII